MKIEPIKENEEKIGAWMKMYGAYIQSREIHLTDKQLKMAADLINDIANQKEKRQYDEER